jgi:hypothetical protein
MVAYLHRRHYRPENRPLRACQPRDLLDQVTALCRYRGTEPTISRELLDAACASYFLDHEAADPSWTEPHPHRSTGSHATRAVMVREKNRRHQPQL